MMTLYDFLQLSMDDYYKINLFYTNTGTELLHQVEVGEIENELEKIGCEDLINADFESWDLCYYEHDEKEELTINIG